ncbi:DUF742 domain-containing protein [Streptomyces sp. ZYX-F-203]
MSTEGRGRDHWFDAEAGPVVRPYAMTRGRTDGAPPHRLDAVAMVSTRAGEDVPEPDTLLSPEHVDILDRCRRTPRSVAALAARLDLPLGVVRVLVGDLLAERLVEVRQPTTPAERPDTGTLRQVIDGLRDW